MAIAVKKTCKNIYQTFLVLSNFTGLLYFVLVILSGIVDVQLGPKYASVLYSRSFLQSLALPPEIVLSYHSLIMLRDLYCTLFIKWLYLLEQPRKRTSKLTVTVKKPVISPNFLVRKFCGKSQFPHSFRRIARNYADVNYVNLRDFLQWVIAKLESYDPYWKYRLLQDN